MSTVEERKAEGYRRRGRPKGRSTERDEQQLRDLRAGYTRTQTAERAGIARQSFDARMSRNPEWKARVLEAEAEGKGKRTALKESSFPDFLEFRERFFVYQDHRTRRFVRAQTNWYQRDSYKRLTEENRLIVIMPPGHLKGHILGTMIPTPKGWVTVGDLRPGDAIFDETGQVCHVVGKSEVFTDKDCYEVEFSSGEKLIVSSDHLWEVRSRKPENVTAVRTTEEMFRTQFVHGRPNYSVAVAPAIQTKPAELPIDPYVFGLWLGDGSKDAPIIHVGDEDADHVITELSGAGMEVTATRRRTAWAIRFNDAELWSRSGVHSRLRALGVLGDKHIPDIYLWASEDQRLALLQGLMDSDGTVGASGAVFLNTNESLSDGVAQLVRSLGCKAKKWCTRAKLNGQDAGPTYTISFWPDFRTFRLERKQAKLRPAKDGRRKRNVIKAIRRVPAQPTQCIAVDSPSHLYLAGEHMVPTHNTTTYCIEYVTWLIMRDRNTRALVIKKSQPESKKDVAAVQERLTCDYYHSMQAMLRDQGDEPNECPICIYFPNEPFKPQGKYSGDKWGAEGFRVMGVTSGEKDDTMQAKGVGSQVLGIRADIIIMDDVQSDVEARTSAASTDDKAMWINASILGRVTMSQKIVYLGNYYAPQDLAHKVISDHPDFALFEYPAILENHPISGKPYKIPKPLCPEFWTYSDLLAKRKEVGEHVWFYTWMQMAGSYEDQTFRREALEAARDETLGLGVVPANVSDLALGVDPGTSTTGFCAMVLWGLDRKTKQRYLIDVFNKSGMRHWDAVMDVMEQYCQLYPVASVIVERRATQGAIIDNPAYAKRIRSTGAKYTDYKTVTGVGGQGITSNFDITTIGRLFDAGLVVLPYGGDEVSREKVDAYINQLTAWHTDAEGRSIKHLTRDMVMATLFAESHTFQIANKPTESPRQRFDGPEFARKSFDRFRQRSRVRV